MPGRAVTAVGAVAGHATRSIRRRIFWGLLVLGFLGAVFSGAALGVFLWLPSVDELTASVVGESLPESARTAGDFLDRLGRLVSGEEL